MSKFTLYTNLLTEEIKEQAKAALIEGKMVCVTTTSPRSEKFQRLQRHVDMFMASIGAHMVQEDIIVSNKYFQLNGDSDPAVFVRLSDVQAILNDSKWLNPKEMRQLLAQADKFDKHGNIIKEE